MLSGHAQRSPTSAHERPADYESGVLPNVQSRLYLVKREIGH
jgi:hypothetical protein